MSNEKDKPKSGETDPEATVTMRRDSLTEPPAQDEDATVMMPAMKAEPEVDEDATVMMSPASAAELAAAAQSGSDEPGFDPDATNVFVPAAPAEPAAPPPPPPPPPSAAPAATMPWNAIAGGVVVLLVILYFVFGGTDTKPPVPKADVAAVPAPVAAPAAEASPASTPSPALATTPATEAAPAATTAAPSPAPTPAPPVASASVKTLLAGEIKRGLVDVTETGGVATITLRDARQFDAGGPDPEARLIPILQGVAAALDKTTGAIIVTGHADTSPSSDTRYPTNKALSAARAEAAAKVMAEKLRDPGRLKSEGASDTEPLVPNDSVANRARNRRIVIVVKPAA